MITEIHWYVVAIYIAVGLVISISFLLRHDAYIDKEIRISILLGWTIATLFIAAIWPVFLISWFAGEMTNKEFISRKWLNKINIVLWKRK